jgi:glycerol-3-phosphate acyltransferase PlsX
MTLIALDAMGGDHGPSVIVPAAIDSLEKNPRLSLILVGDEKVLATFISAGVQQKYGARLSIHHASEKVEMHELPSKALRNKKDSSMRVAINLVKEKRADACVSAGNTGALMAIARFVLKTIPGIDRPAIIGVVPSSRGYTHVLDLGANVDSSAEHLLQFAVMGSELVRAIHDIEHPTVGLLNIGEEEIKGNEQVKQASKLLHESPLNFVGYVEGNDMFLGTVDLVVTDGFVGNVALKAIEGLAKLFFETMRKEFRRNWMTRLAALVAKPVLMAFRDGLDPRHFNGATLIGLRGIVIKSHGNADRLAFAVAIEQAVKEVDKSVPDLISERVSKIIAAQGGQS